MLARLKRGLIGVSVSVVAVMGFMTFLAPTPIANAAACGDGTDTFFLNFPTWWRGLPCDGTHVKLEGEIGTIAWTIALNVVDMLVQVIAIIATVMVIWNGIQYMLAQGNQDQIVKARKGIMQAAVGLIIGVLASTIVGFIVSNVLSASGSTIHNIPAGKLLAGGMNMLFWLIGIICVGMIIFSSFQYLTSKGFEDKALQARRTLLGAVIGLAITILALFIINVVIGIVS